MATMSAMSSPARGPKPLRVLSLDGGGVKGYSSLLILKRILRTIASESALEGPQPLPCDVFDLIAGTSTGGLIAIMLGRLHMSIDDCLKQYESTSAAIFGSPVSQSKLGKVLKKVSSGSFYDLAVLEQEIRRLLRDQGKDPDEGFLEENPRCKVMVCVTRSITSKADVLRNYTSHHPTQNNYECSIWEAACATAAAPMFFKSVKFGSGGEEWCDGAMRRNNPINEAMNEVDRETERDWKARRLGCVISIGTGVVDSAAISNSTTGLIKSVIKIMTDSEDVADGFRKSSGGQQLHQNGQYFRFSVPQGMQTLKLDEWKEIEKMKGVTTEYLSKYDVGDAVKSCARSLSNLDGTCSTSTGIDVTVRLKRPTTLCDNPCASYVDRPVYLSALRTFFWDYDGSRSQSFVLWGTGGVGKTQLALKFAQVMEARVSVLWVRADQSNNFYHDYSKVMRQLRSNDDLGSRPDEPQPATENLEHRLEEARSSLEAIAADWLLILDNADDIDDFRGSMDPYIPRKGRVLITTRDPRFQGEFTTADNGLNVVPMDDEGSVQLLAKLVPPRLRGKDPDKASLELVSLLGNLPLGIAQAAANIVDQQISLHEYVISYRNASDRLGALLEVPMRDRLSRDPRNSIQSVNITWEISFERLESSSPLSVTLLGYLSCFHWESIPRDLIRHFRAFSGLSDVEFRQVISRPVQLSLLEEYNTKSYPLLRMHPLVHEYSWKRIGNESGIPEILEPCIETLSSVFPRSGGLEEDGGWQVCSVLASHALRLIQLSESRRSESRDLLSLMQRVAQYLNTFGLLDLACDISARALEMGHRVWHGDRIVESSLRRTRISCLRNNRRFKEALEENEVILKSLRTPESVGSMENRDEDLLTTLETKYWILQSLHRYQESYETNTEIEALLPLHQERRTSDLESLTHKLVVKHNGAFALSRTGQHNAALSINNEVLGEAKDGDGNIRVPKNIYHAFLNLRGRVLRDISLEGNGNCSEALEIFQGVYEEALQLWGFQDKDTWVALNEILETLEIQYDASEAGVSALSAAGALIMQALEGCVSSSERTRRDGVPALKSESFRRAIELFLGHVYKYISIEQEERRFLDDSGIQNLIGKMMEEFLPGGKMFTRDFVSTNAVGVRLQAVGRPVEAETYHRRALEGLLDWCGLPNRPALIGLQTEEEINGTAGIFHYNIMLAVARQGRLDEAEKYRTEYEDLIELAEAKYGTLAVRMERDRRDRQIYDETRLKMGECGDQLRDSEWWEQHKKELARAEKRYGILTVRTEAQPRPDLRDGPSNSNGDTVNGGHVGATNADLAGLDEEKRMRAKINRILPWKRKGPRK